MTDNELNALSKAPGNRSADANTSSPQGRAWNLSRGIAEGRAGGGAGGLIRLNHGEVCTSDCGVTRQRGQTHVSGREVESHSEATGQDSQKIPQSGGNDLDLL